jgi:hypothetical protein
MAKPTDDLEAVRAIVEALQGFDAGDQERIIRWAREKLRLVESPAPPPSTPLKPMPAPAVLDRPAPPVLTPTPRKLEVVERPVAERPAKEVPQVEAPEVEQPATNYLEAERAERVEPAPEQSEAANMLMPAPEHKNRAFLIIGIIVMAIAVGFLVLMIMSHGK